MALFASPFGSFDLEPLHTHNSSPIQAWNAADELALKHLAALDLKPASTLVVNDQHGALAIALNQWQPHSWSDSYCSLLAWRKNQLKNQVKFPPQAFIPSNQPLTGTFDCVIFKLPKTLSLLQHQLVQLRPHIGESTTIIAAGMIKHMSATMTHCFEELIGPTTTSLAEKKARLILPTFNSELAPNAPVLTMEYPIPETPLTLYSGPNVFSQQRLDMGTRFLIEQLDQLPAPTRIVDLGCGNGALGCYMGWRHPTTEILFCDESYLAVSSAEQSWQQNGLTNPAEFKVCDGLAKASVEADLILCNPPFHQGNRLDHQTAMRLFRSASHNLAIGGKLMVVGNRHLNYHQSLKRIFGSADLVASNAKFVILSAIKN